VLSMLEEFVLLAVDERTGQLESRHELGTGYALIGAVFFDLALTRKIDTDTEEIQILDSNASGNLIWDRVIAEMRERPDVKTVRDWIEAMFRRNDDLEGEALASLVEQGILQHERTKRLWIIDVERFPLVDGRAQKGVKERLAQAILGDGIPDTRDIMLVSLAEPCGLLRCVLTEQELEARRERIELLSNLETISRKVVAAITELDASFRHAPPRLS
jgi:golgi phosphoprotein 3